MPVETEDIKEALFRAKETLEFSVVLTDEAAEHIAASACGDVRKALNSLEVSVMAAKPDENQNIVVTIEIAEAVTMKKAFRHDRDGDSHYELLSALQKSIRGSDENAAVFYLAKLLEGGDIISPCRRLLVIASEDIGLAYPMAAVIVKSLVDSALQLGLPEARIPLANAAVMLATSPKSNSAYAAINAASEDIKAGLGSEIPFHLRSPQFKGYKYPHDYPNRYVKQQYLPDDLKDRRYYEFGDNKTEQAAKVYWDKIKGNK
jgi:putative ATPase